MHSVQPKRRGWQSHAAVALTNHKNEARRPAYSDCLGLLWNMVEAWLWQLRPPSQESQISSSCASIHKARTLPMQHISAITTRLLILSLLLCPSTAVLINFENCLGPNIIYSPAPQPLQWVPLFVNVVFNSSAPSHNLNVTVYGNVTGQTTVQPLPPPDSLDWTNPNDTLGKIIDLDPINNDYSTFLAAFDVLTYTPYSAPASRFCNNTLNTACPIGPVFSNV